MSSSGEAANLLERRGGDASFGPALVEHVLRAVPRGRLLPTDVWERRHRVILALLYLHAVGLTALALARGFGAGHSLFEGSVVALLATAAAWTGAKRSVRAGLASLGLLASSGILVHVTGGLIESHFHFFVMVGVIALYQDWIPFLLAIGYVVVHHGTVGVLDPESVYNHEAAWRHPWLWAGIHGVFVAAASIASLVAWRLNEHQALHDSLTKLANRALFRRRLEQACRGDARLAVLFLDLDNFKAVNDSFGHAAGDELLTTVGRRLRGCVRSGDMVARLGGDEFGFLLEGLADSDEAVRVAQRITEGLRRPFLLHDREVWITGSVGIALSDGVPWSAEELLRNADVAMYEAKALGKSGYTVFEPRMYADVIARLELEADLQRAAELEEFTVHYQPIVSLETGILTGVEALLRWNHPRHGLLLPSEFVPVAEESGVIIQLGRLVLDRACRDAGRWPQQDGGGSQLTMNVNLSGTQLQHPSLTEDIRGALERSGLEPERLVLEITEGALLRDSDVIGTLEELKQLGVRLAVDDFGTGYSSLSYLRRFPIDVLKIDQSFVQSLGGSSEELELARAIVAFGTTLGLETVAEGIEQEQEALLLREAGCDLGQGFLFAEPLPAGEMDRFFHEFRAAPELSAASA
jgi:diguanylate cyclase (GGDEF)-like protein